MSDAPSPPRWLWPTVVAFVAAVVGHALFDGRGPEVYRVVAAVALAYLALDATLRGRFADEMTRKRVLQILSALALSVTSLAALLDRHIQEAPLTGWSSWVAASLGIEIAVTAAGLVTATRAQLAMPALLVHHVLLLLACDYVARHRLGTGAMVTALFQETTNVGWYLHWVLNSPESKYHERWPVLFNVNALFTIAWYAVGRFVVALPILIYLLWKTPPGAPVAYVVLYTVGLVAQAIMNAQNVVKLAKSYPRCASSWLHRAIAPTGASVTPTSTRA